MTLIRPDEDLNNADWTKQSWDLEVYNVEDLRKWIAEQGMTIDEFKSLPVYQKNKEVHAWLKDL